MLKLSRFWKYTCLFPGFQLQKFSSAQLTHVCFSALQKQGYDTWRKHFMFHKPSGVTLPSWIPRSRTNPLRVCKNNQLKISSRVISQGWTDFSGLTKTGIPVQQWIASTADRTKRNDSHTPMSTSKPYWKPIYNQSESDNWIICSLNSFHVDMPHRKPNYNQAFVQGAQKSKQKNSLSNILKHQGKQSLLSFSTTGLLL